MKLISLILLVVSITMFSCQKEIVSSEGTQVPPVINLPDEQSWLETLPERDPDADEYALLVFDGDSVLLTLPQDTSVFYYNILNEPYPYVVFMDRFPVNEHSFAVEIQLQTTTVGEYFSDMPYNHFVWDNRIYMPNGNMKYTVTEYGDVGEFIAVSFEGNMQFNVPTDVHAVSGKIRIKRAY